MPELQITDAKIALIHSRTNSQMAAIDQVFCFVLNLYDDFVVLFFHLQTIVYLVFIFSSSFSFSFSPSSFSSFYFFFFLFACCVYSLISYSINVFCVFIIRVCPVTVCSTLVNYLYCILHSILFGFILIVSDWFCLYMFHVSKGSSRRGKK